MALDNEDPGLRAAAASARAQNRTSGRIVPPMPPDEMASPFARGRQTPVLHSVTQESLERQDLPSPKPAKKAKVEEPKTSEQQKQRAKATVLVQKLLETWFKEAKSNPARADRNLGLALMLNGSSLIECAYPLDTLNGLINIKQRLFVSSQDDDAGSEEAEKVHEWMTRKDEPTEKEEPDGDEE